MGKRILCGRRKPAAQYLETSGGFLGAVPGQSPNGLARGLARQQQLPGGSMTQFDGLPAQLQLPVRAGGEVDGAGGNLGGQAQCIGCGGAVRHDGFAALPGEAFDDACCPRSVTAKACLNRQHVDAPGHTQQPTTSLQA